MSLIVLVLILSLDAFVVSYYSCFSVCVMYIHVHHRVCVVDCVLICYCVPVDVHVVIYNCQCGYNSHEIVKNDKTLSNLILHAHNHYKCIF